MEGESETNVNEDNTEIFEDLNENVVEVVVKAYKAATKKLADLRKFQLLLETNLLFTFWTPS